MLTPADRKLCSRDETGTILAAVLDHETRSELFGELFGKSHSVEYLRFKPDIGFVAGLTVRSSLTTQSPFDGPRFGFVQALTDRANPKFDKLLSYAETHGYNRELVLRRDLGVAAGYEVADRQVPGIHRLSDSSIELRGLRYKPFRRWVGHRKSTKSKREFVKAYSRGDLPMISVIKDLIAAEVHTPAVRAEKSHRDILAFDWSDGTSFQELDSRPAEAENAVGIQLGRVHGSAPTRQAELSWSKAKSSQLLSSQQAISVLLPEHGDRIRQLSRQISSLLFETPQDLLLTRVHGDFSIDQVLLEPTGEITIVDFDRSTFDEPEADLATWLATDMMLHLRDSTPLDPGLFSRLLSGYQSVTHTSLSSRFAPLVAAQLLHLSVTPFRNRWPDWDRSALEFIAQAELAVKGQLWI